MTEKEDLLWNHPEKFLNEPLTQFRRQPSSAVGRADLIFEDRIGRLLIIELKKGTLERGAIPQLVDYLRNGCRIRYNAATISSKQVDRF